MGKKDKKEIILHTAEKLLRESGSEGLSLRSLGKQAKVNVASINYYFGSKKGLGNALLTSIFYPYEEKRIELLQNLIASKVSYDPGDVINCFFLPTKVLIRMEPDHKNLFMGIGTLFSNFGDFKTHFQEISREVIEAYSNELSRLLPEVPRERIFAKVIFMWTLANQLVNIVPLEDSLARYEMQISPNQAIEEITGFVARNF